MKISRHDYLVQHDFVVDDIILIIRIFLKLEKQKMPSS